MRGVSSPAVTAVIASSMSAMSFLHSPERHQRAPAILQCQRLQIAVAHPARDLERPVRVGDGRFRLALGLERDQEPDPLEPPMLGAFGQLFEVPLGPADPPLPDRPGEPMVVVFRECKRHGGRVAELAALDVAPVGSLPRAHARGSIGHPPGGLGQAFEVLRIQVA